MPIEIRELIIRATVSQEQNNEQNTSRLAAGQNSRNNSSSGICSTRIDELKKMIQDKNER